MRRLSDVVATGQHFAAGLPGRVRHPAASERKRAGEGEGFQCGHAGNENAVGRPRQLR